jgi:hypothetical protein
VLRRTVLSSGPQLTSIAIFCGFLPWLYGGNVTPTCRALYEIYSVKTQQTSSSCNIVVSGVLYIEGKPQFGSLLPHLPDITTAPICSEHDR